MKQVSVVLELLIIAVDSIEEGDRSIAPKLADFLPPEPREIRVYSRLEQLLKQHFALQEPSAVSWARFEVDIRGNMSLVRSRVPDESWLAYEVRDRLDGSGHPPTIGRWWCYGQVYRYAHVKDPDPEQLRADNDTLLEAAEMLHFFDEVMDDEIRSPSASFLA